MVWVVCQFLMYLLLASELCQFCRRYKKNYTYYSLKIPFSFEDILKVWMCELSPKKNWAFANRAIGFFFYASTIYVEVKVEKSQCLMKKRQGIMMERNEAAVLQMWRFVLGKQWPLLHPRPSSVCLRSPSINRRLNLAPNELVRMSKMAEQHVILLKSAKSICNFINNF